MLVAVCLLMRPESTAGRLASLGGTFLVLAGVRLALAVLPFFLVARLVARLSSRRRWLPARRAADVARRVARVAALVPGAACLPQAQAAARLLSWHGHPSVVRIGVCREGRDVVAHAWVEHAGQVVLGGPDVSRYVPLVRGSLRDA